MITMVIILAFLCILKIYSNSNLKSALFESKIYIVLASIRDANNLQDFNKNFTSGDFCGWKLSNNTGLEQSSANYQTTAKNGKILEQQFTTNEVDYKFALCVTDPESFTRSSKRQTIGILFFTGLLILLIINTRFVEDEEDKIKKAAAAAENKPTIPNA